MHHRPGASVEQRRPPHHVPEAFDVQRVLADQQLFEGRNDEGAPGGAGPAVALQSLVRADLDSDGAEGPVRHPFGSRAALAGVLGMDLDRPGRLASRPVRARGRLVGRQGVLRTGPHHADVRDLKIAFDRPLLLRGSRCRRAGENRREAEKIPPTHRWRSRGAGLFALSHAAVLSNHWRVARASSVRFAIRDRIATVTVWPARGRAVYPPRLARLPMLVERFLAPLRALAPPGSQVTGQRCRCQYLNQTPPARRPSPVPNPSPRAGAGSRRALRRMIRLGRRYLQVAVIGSMLTCGSRDFSRSLISLWSADDARFRHSCGSSSWS